MAFIPVNEHRQNLDRLKNYAHEPAAQRLNHRIASLKRFDLRHQIYGHRSPVNQYLKVTYIRLFTAT